MNELIRTIFRVVSQEEPKQINYLLEELAEELKKNTHTPYIPKSEMPISLRTGTLINCIRGNRYALQTYNKANVVAFLDSGMGDLIFLDGSLREVE